MNPRELQIRQARSVRVADEPTLSLVVISEKGRADLDAYLEAWLPVCKDLEAELIVVRSAGPEEIRDLRRIYPSVRFTAAPSGATGEDMRALGIKAADGDIVLFQPELPVDGKWIPPRAFERRHAID